MLIVEKERSIAHAHLCTLKPSYCEMANSIRESLGSFRESIIATRARTVKLWNKTIIFRMALIASSGGMMFGFNAINVSSALVSMTRELNLSPKEQSLIIAVMPIGSILGLILVLKPFLSFS